MLGTTAISSRPEVYTRHALRSVVASARQLGRCPPPVADSCACADGVAACGAGRAGVEVARRSPAAAFLGGSPVSPRPAVDRVRTPTFRIARPQPDPLPMARCSTATCRRSRAPAGLLAGRGNGRARQYERIDPLSSAARRRRGEGERRRGARGARRRLHGVRAQREPGAGVPRPRRRRESGREAARTAGDARRARPGVLRPDGAVSATGRPRASRSCGRREGWQRISRPG